MTGGEGGERFRVGGGEKEGENGGGEEKKGKERVSEKRDGNQEEAGLCGCLGVCRCGSSGN